MADMATCQSAALSARSRCTTIMVESWTMYTSE